MSRNSVLIIPSFNPDEKLVGYIKDLISNGFQKIILVDDGSSPKSKSVFEAAYSMPECDLLVHTVNMGKGRALKDAFNYYCQKYAEDYSGVITVDSDGQHTLEDVVRLDNALKESPGSLILGVRDFDDPSVPFKSRFGNKITRNVMGLLIGSANREGLPAQGNFSRAISDTQTGMRAIPNPFLASYLTLAGERFEYETNMLMEALHSHTPIQEIGIQTVYINENSQTHFRPLADSFAIYRLIFSTFFKYTLASLSAFLIDYSIYSMLIFMLGFLAVGPKILIATAAARAVSSLYNYTVNMDLVFRHNEANRKKALFKYYSLCIVQFSCSALFVWMLCTYAYFSELSAKLFVDTLLFLISFQVQQNWVFREAKA